MDSVSFWIGALGIVGVAVASFGLRSALSIAIARSKADESGETPASITIEVTYENGKHFSLNVPHPDDPAVSEVIRELRLT